MALARSRQATRRVKDRWKAKLWYKITAPVAFNSHVIGETMADDSSKLIGRTAEATLQDLTGDMRQMHVKLFFRINSADETQAKTEYIGHAMTSDYVRRLTRRGHTKISAVFDVKTKDGSRLRIKPFAVTDRRCQTTQAQLIRAKMQELITATAAESNLTVFLKDVLVGEMSNRIYKEARKIHPVRRIEIAKAELVRGPSMVDETPVMIIEPESEEPETVEEVAVEGEEGETVEGADDETVEGADGEAVSLDGDDDGEAVEGADDSEE
jgi:small subunit ribosomal protein S3Ae